jgi:hypothetical protein
VGVVAEAKVRRMLVAGVGALVAIEPEQVCRLQREQLIRLLLAGVARVARLLLACETMEWLVQILYLVLLLLLVVALVQHETTTVEVAVRVAARLLVLQATAALEIRP